MDQRNSTNSNHKSKEDDFSIEEKLIVATWVHDRYLTAKSIDNIRNEFESRFKKRAPSYETMMMWENNVFSTGSIERQPFHHQGNQVCSTCQKNRVIEYSAPPHRTNFYKTEICHQYQKYGRCDFGQACTFAHGIRELKKIPGYKTKICSNFLQKGHCEFGSRCIFLHKRQSSSNSQSNIEYKSGRIDKAKSNYKENSRHRSIHYSKNYRS